MDSKITETLANADIKEQVGRIVSSRLFAGSAILTNFLSFVVEETLLGNQKQLKEYIIGTKVLSKRSDFNPQYDAIVRIHAGRLRRALNEYYLETGNADPIVVSMPKGSYVPEFKINTVKDIPVVKDEIVYRKKTTVAVLPFRNINPDDPLIFFADGLADQISTELTNYSELAVVSYYSCRNLVSKTTDIKEAGVLLNASYIITGTVQSDSNNMRVRTQLISSETNEQLWTHSYERSNSVSGLFEIQDEIVKRVVSQLAGHYGAIFRDVARIPNKANHENINIYNAIFWYYHNVNEVSLKFFTEGKDALESAVKRDPDYALGWAVLGEIYISGHFMQFSNNIPNAPEEALKCGRRAMKIDPLCQHAYQTMALANIFSHNREACLETVNLWSKLEFKAAGIMGGIGFCLVVAGEYERGIKMLDESVHLNPYYQWWFNGGFSIYHFQKKEYEDAYYWAQKMNMPNVIWDSILKAASLANLGRIEEAKANVLILEQMVPGVKNFIKPYLGAFIQSEDLVERLYKSLLKAGFKIK